MSSLVSDLGVVTAATGQSQGLPQFEYRPPELCLFFPFSMADPRERGGAGAL